MSSATKQVSVDELRKSDFGIINSFRWEPLLQSSGKTVHVTWVQTGARCTNVTVGNLDHLLHRRNSRCILDQSQKIAHGAPLGETADRAALLTCIVDELIDHITIHRIQGERLWRFTGDLKEMLLEVEILQEAGKRGRREIHVVSGGARCGIDMRVDGK